jgi:hypothetical protein
MKNTNPKRVRNLYPLSMSMRYTAHNVLKQYEGSGKTMLLNGREVFFTADKSLEVGMEISVSVEWPVVLENNVQLQLVVEGDIVRSEGKWTKLEIKRYHFKTRGQWNIARPPLWMEPRPYLARAIGM